MAQPAVPKEYVRQQLKSMGLENVSEEDLEAYTRDFSRLIQEHLRHDMSQTPPSSMHMGSSGAALSQQDDATGQTPQSLQQEHHTSAVFKTFPGDQESRVQYLPPSATPSPMQVPPYPHQGHTPPSTENSVLSSGEGRRKTLRRKVLRRCNGEARVFDESISTEGGSVAGSPGVDPLAGRLSDLSITSLSSSTTDPHSEAHTPMETLPHKQQYKSFIRPSTCHPHLRGIKKCDPVTRYHEFRQAWETYKAPGEKNRNGLRWHIKELMMQQDVPQYEPVRRVYKPNDFVVPTEKKRSALRWEVRYQLAQQ